MEDLKMAATMVALYQIFPEIGHMCMANDRNVLHKAVTSGVITYTEYCMLMRYIGE